MKNSSPADEQPIEVSTVPTRSLANNNENEKERAQASLPSGSTSSEEQPTASSQYPEKEDNGELPDHAILADISTTDLSLENGNGMPSVKDISMVQETPHGNEVPVSTLSDPSPKEDISQDEASPVASPLASPTPATQTPAAKRGMSPAAKWLIIGIIALVLIAGGVGGLLIFLLPRAPATGGTPSAVTSPSSITTPASSVVATRTGSSIPAISNGTVNLTFSGAVIGQMTGTNVVTCGSVQSVTGGTQYHVAVLGTVNGQQYALTFGVYPYTRPDTYTSSAFSFFGPSGSNSSVAQWRASPDLGISVTINSDGKSGSLEIGYISSSANTTAHVSGSWKCA